MKIYKIAFRPKDTDRLPISLKDEYILKVKWDQIKNMDDPYFFGSGSWHAPVMVLMPNQAHIFDGNTLLNSAWPWYERYDAIRWKTSV
jgi:hypothetical protein